jgi:hypothetical protein
LLKGFLLKGSPEGRKAEFRLLSSAVDRTAPRNDGRTSWSELFRGAGLKASKPLNVNVQIRTAGQLGLFGAALKKILVRGQSVLQGQIQKKASTFMQT